MASVHSAVSPSSAGRWVECTASVRHSALRPVQEDETASKEGTAAHWVLAQMLAGGALAPTDPDGTAITEEMLDGAGFAVETIAAYYGPDLKSEVSVPITRVSPECFGTIDLHHVDHTYRTIRVWDYKFGWRPVEARNNWQLIAYAAGIMDALRIDGASDQAWRVELGIIQPRPWHRDGPARVWAVTASDLRGHVNRLQAAAEEALRGTPHYKTGAYCDMCPARHECPALQTHAGLHVDMVATPDLPLSAPVAQQARELMAVEDALAVLTARRSGLAAALEAHARAGVSVPGWGMVPKTGKLDWSIPAEQVVGLGQMCGADLSKPGALTPTQAKKKGISPEVLDAVTTRAQSMSFERVNTSDLERVFNHGNAKN